MASTSASREIRIFLSSTFSDMQETRNYLTKKIFPKIEKECSDRGVRFTVLDLRWGITESESKTGKVIEICIDEINRTRPFFIGLVGDRYGWIPDEEEMRRNRHLEEKYPWVREYMKRGVSITEMEMQYGVLDSDIPVEAFFFLKDGNSETGSQEEAAKLAALKAKIREKAAEGVCSAETYHSIEQLGRLVHERLMAMIDTKFPADMKLSPFDRFMLRQESELEEYRNGYIDLCGRTDHIDSLLGDCRIFLADESGSGKSALLANCGRNAEIRIIRTNINDSINSVGQLMNILLRCLGLTDSDPCDARRTEETAPDIAAVFNEKGFSEDVVWIIDGLEKLPAANMTALLPLFKLPDQVKTVISADDKTFESLRDYAGDFTCIGVSSLNKAEMVHLIRHTLQRHAKKLTAEMELHIMRCDFLSKPSMLKVFIHALVQFGIFEELDSFIHRLTGAGSETEFMGKILEIAEDDFGREDIEHLLGTLACASCGLNEKQIMEKWNYTPLAWSALYSAVEVFIYRQNGCIILRSGFRSFVKDRYLADPSAASSARNTTVSLLREEMCTARRELFSRRSGMSLTDRMIMKIWGIWLTDKDISRSCNIFREIVLLLIDSGQWKLAADVLVSENLVFSMDCFRGYEYFSVLHGLLSHGFNPCRLFTFRDMLLFSMIGKDESAQMLWSMFTNLSRASADILPKLRRHFSRMPLGKDFKRRILSVLDECFTGSGTDVDTTDFEDSWIPGKDDTDLSRLAVFFDRIVVMENLEHVKKILQKSEEMTKSLPDNAMTKTFFMMFIPICLLRLGKTDEAREQYGRLLDNCESDPAIFAMLRFEFAFTEKDWKLCRETAEEVRHMAGIFTGEMKNGGRMRYLRMLTAIGESWSYDGYDRDRLIQEYRDVCADNAGFLSYFADWLSVKNLYIAAAQVYGIASEVSETEILKGYYQYKKGKILQREARTRYNIAWTQSQYDRDMRRTLMQSAGTAMEEAVGHFQTAGEEGREWVGDSLDQAGICFTEAGETDKAIEIIRRRLQVSKQMENKANGGEIAASYNYAAILCHSLCTAKDIAETAELKEIAAIGCDTMIKVLQNAPDEITYLKNLVTIMVDVKANGLLSTDRLGDVTGRLETMLISKDGTSAAGRHKESGGSPEAGVLDSLPAETADRLFSLACVTRRGILAGRLMKNAVATGHKINGREDEWNIGLVDICSDDPGKVRQGASAVTDTLLSFYEKNPLQQWWDEVPPETGRPMVKSLCRERGTDGLLLLWCIARCEKNDAEADAIRDKIRDIVTSPARIKNTMSSLPSGDSDIDVEKTDDEEMDLLDRFLILHIHYQPFTMEEFIVFQTRTCRDWRPDLFPETEICSSCLRLCIEETDWDHGHPFLYEFIAETIKGSVNPAETLLTFIENISSPQEETFRILMQQKFNARTQWVIEIVMIPAGLLDTGEMTLDDVQMQRLRTGIGACLKMLTDDPEADSYDLRRLHEVCMRYGLTPDTKILSALLEDAHGEEFIALVRKMETDGYEPDADILGRIVSEDLRNGDIAGAAEDFERFRLKAADDESYSTAVAFLRGLLETARGEYEKGYVSFTEVDRASEDDDRPEHCIRIWGNIDDFDICLYFHLFVCAAYSGRHTEALELAPKVFRYRTCDYSWDIDSLPTCLLLLKNGLYDDAAILYASKINNNIENGIDVVKEMMSEDADPDKDDISYTFFETTYIRAILMLIHIEKAVHAASAGEPQAKLVLSIAKGLMRGWLPPMCAFEYDKAKTLIYGTDLGNPEHE